MILLICDFKTILSFFCYTLSIIMNILIPFHFSEVSSDLDSDHCSFYVSDVCLYSM